ncbi:hypothetical protein OHA72_38565 [Dactylosporangium sp. NBC_01737]|nr:hypothetical protein OHA72_38565 [Dactylosporangium sp. NBC_01737]
MNRDQPLQRPGHSVHRDTPATAAAIRTLRSSADTTRQQLRLPAATW